MHLILSYKNNIYIYSYISEEMVQDFKQVLPSSAFKLAIPVGYGE